MAKLVRTSKLEVWPVQPAVRYLEAFFPRFIRTWRGGSFVTFVAPPTPALLELFELLCSLLSGFLVSNNS